MSFDKQQAKLAQHLPTVNVGLVSLRQKENRRLTMGSYLPIFYSYAAAKAWNPAASGDRDP
jgi:hypothetical protein